MPPLGGGGGGHEPGGSGSHDDHPARRFRLRDGGHGGFPARKRVEGAGDGDHLVGIAHAALPTGHAGTDFVLAPGWTSYRHRLQVQTYDVTELLSSENELSILVGKGWYRSPLAWPDEAHRQEKAQIPAGLIALLTITYTDGSTQLLPTGADWSAYESNVRFSEIYDGETYDAAFDPSSAPIAIAEFDGPSDTLIAQQGEKITEQERILKSPVMSKFL